MSMEKSDIFGAFESTWIGGASSMPADDSIRDDEQAIIEFIWNPFPSIPPAEAAGQPNKRRGSPPDGVDGRDGKRIKSIDNGGVSGPIMLSDIRQMQRSTEDEQTLLFSGSPTADTRNSLLDASGSRQNVQHISSFKLDRAKHKIFLSHSGAQKIFVEQLCVDLEARGYFFPFFDQRYHSLPKGKDFVPLIKEAAQLCCVAVMVLSEEFFCSKWPMIELAEFHAAQQAGNEQLKMFPLFYKLSIDELDDRSIDDRWMPIWIQHASKDERIDVKKWSAAGRALRRANGLININETSEVAYRMDIVESIFRLSPPDLLYGSCRDMVGYDRMCEMVSSKFVDNSTVGARVLGLHGTTGVGKSTLSKALCDFFDGEFSGRVCHVQLDETPRLKRVKFILKRLCGFEKNVLDRITDVGQGLRQMRQFMKRKPVFFAIDNVTNDDSSWRAAHEYLMVGFHPQSRIMVTSRSEAIVQDLLPDINFCMPMPRLSAKEAGAIFLRSAAPSKSSFMLTDEERRIVGLCIQPCLFESKQDILWCEPVRDGSFFLSDEHVIESRWKSYHPLALSAFGDFFRRYFSNAQMLRWKDHLEENKVDPLKDVWKSTNGIGRIIGLQFSILHPSEQLLFLDIALYSMNWRLSQMYIGSRDYVKWLSKVHDESIPVILRKLQDLKRSGMIDYEGNYNGERSDNFFDTVHGLYKEFAEWYVTEHGMRGLKNAWVVFQSPATILKCDSSASDLVRLRMFHLTRASARLFASKTMQELHNLEVLQLHCCTNFQSELNLQGLKSLRHLELIELTNLVTVTLTGSSSTDENLGIYESLQCVLLEDLDSLTYCPDVRSCTSLHWFSIYQCPKLTNFEGLECPHLKELDLSGLVTHQLARLPNVKSLHSMERFFVRTDGYVDISDAIDAVRELDFRDLKLPYFRVLEELLKYLRTKWVEPAEDERPRKGWTKIVWNKKGVRSRSEELGWRDTGGRCCNWGYGRV